MIEYLRSNASSISFSIVLSGFLINLLLGLFIVYKKSLTTHMKRLSALFFLASVSMLFEGLSYVCAIMKLGPLPMRVLTVLVIWTSAFLCCNYYSYLVSYYEYKQKPPYPKNYTKAVAVYAIIIAVSYAILSPTGLLFDVTPEGKYVVTDLSFLPVVLMLPLLFFCLQAIFKGRNLTSKTINICFFAGVIIIFLGGALDSITGISLNFLLITLMNMILYNVIMHDQELELEKAIKTEQQSRARSDFLTNMSHDIRTPMNAVLGFTELAKKDVEDTELVKDYLDKISSSGEYLLSLINDVLDMSRIESGSLSLNEAPFDISDAVNEVETLVSSRMKQKVHHFVVEKIDLPQTGVISDKLRLKQVLVNMLGNAVKYTPPGGEISLSVSTTDSADSDSLSYVFVIKDNGVGMDSDYIAHIFEPFSRERTSTVSKQQGTGLGMAITSKIVESMHGTIKVESKVNVGSTFTVTVPLKTCDLSLVEKGNNKEDYDFSGKRVLLAEDNELNRIIAIKLLEDKGITVEVAKDGKEALLSVGTKEAGYFDAVLMDIQMPIMNGYEATTAIRTLNYEKSRVPIIAMTANAFKEDIDEAMSAGMDAYVKKPIDLDELFSTLNKFLNKD